MYRNLDENKFQPDPTTVAAIEQLKVSSFLIGSSSFLQYLLLKYMFENVGVGNPF